MFQSAFFRYPAIAAVATTLFWYIFSLVFGNVPDVHAITFGIFTVPVPDWLQSRWMDIPGAAIFMFLLLIHLVDDESNIYENLENPNALSSLVSMSAILSFVFALIGFSGATIVVSCVVWTFISMTSLTRFSIPDGEGKVEHVIMWCMIGSSFGAGVATNLSVGIFVFIEAIIASILGFILVVIARRAWTFIHPYKTGLEGS